MAQNHSEHNRPIACLFKPKSVANEAGRSEAAAKTNQKVKEEEEALEHLKTN